MAVFLHCVDTARPGDKSMLLDFVGLRECPHPLPSRGLTAYTHAPGQDPAPLLVLGLDALLALLQLLIVYIAYLCDPLPTSPDPHLPTVLLAPGMPVPDPLLPGSDEVEEESRAEGSGQGWTIARRRGRRRMGKGRYDALQNEEEGMGAGERRVIDLDDSGDESVGREAEDERTSCKLVRGFGRMAS